MMNDKVFLVIIEDRHTDVTVHPFSDAGVAIEEAKRVAEEYGRENDYYEEHDYGKDDGWLFFARYTGEGDSVRVVEAELDEMIA
jgi:hypothetical protein